MLEETLNCSGESHALVIHRSYDLCSPQSGVTIESRLKIGLDTFVPRRLVLKRLLCQVRLCGVLW